MQGILRQLVAAYEDDRLAKTMDEASLVQSVKNNVFQLSAENKAEGRVETISESPLRRSIL